MPPEYQHTMTTSWLLWICFLIFANSAAGKQWAFLVAGSKGWVNYRHQADLCHAYQVIRRAGVPAENIVTMFVDDVAHSSENPNPGVLINRPNGTNVYEGVIKDYTHNDVSVDNLLNVLTGKKTAMKGIGSGRVIESGPEDTVFVNLVDHGSPGFVDINEGVLYADQLNDALKEMKEKNMYKKMVIYVETCESGSMFDSITSDDGNVFVMTAAAPDEPSYVTYYDENLATYLGDMFSTAWMELVEELLDESNTLQIPLFKMYTHVRSLVASSHVMMYGDFRLGFDKIIAYFGNRNPALNSVVNLNALPSNSVPSRHVDGEKISSMDVNLNILKKKLQRAKDPSEKQKITAELNALSEGRDNIDSAIEEALTIMAGDDSKLYIGLANTKQRPDPSVFPCYRAVVSMFNRVCVNINEHPYATKHFRKLMNICVNNIKLSTARNSFKTACDENFKRSLKTKIF